jgi:hypothetical protein
MPTSVSQILSDKYNIGVRAWIESEMPILWEKGN